MKPVSYDDPAIAMLTEIEPVIEDLPADWHSDAAIEALTSPSTDDILLNMELLAMQEAHDKGIISEQQLMEYIRS